MNAETDSFHPAAPLAGRTSGDAAPNAPSAYTRGPWKVRKEWHGDGKEVYPDRKVSIGQPSEVCVVSGVYDECAANASLIAAAPDLYVASQKAHDALTSAACFFHSNPQMRLLVAEALSAVKDAIAKATIKRSPRKRTLSTEILRATGRGRMNKKELSNE